MGFIRKFIRNLIPNRNYQSFETERIKTGKFCVIRRKRKTSSIGEILRSISFFIAALCIFEAAVWFSSGFPEPANNRLRIQYLETRLSLYQQPTYLEHPFEITSQIISQSALLLLAVINTQFIFDQNKYLTDKYKQESPTNNLLLHSINQSRHTDWIVLQFLTKLASPKKLGRWIQ
mmetsp:Transcript_20988/g.33515  ORF Transcript_20988/g.33515 Transcript_20988/m.33515 type:complete len:176 (-) Transcript_20988:2722-3249(-)